MCSALCHSSIIIHTSSLGTCRPYFGKSEGSCPWTVIRCLDTMMQGRKTIQNCISDQLAFVSTLSDIGAITFLMAANYYIFLFCRFPILSIFKIIRAFQCEKLTSVFDNCKWLFWRFLSIGELTKTNGHIVMENKKESAQIKSA